MLKLTNWPITSCLFYILTFANWVISLKFKPSTKMVGYTPRSRWGRSPSNRCVLFARVIINAARGRIKPQLAMRRRRSSNVNKPPNTVTFMNEALPPNSSSPRLCAAAVLMVFSHDLVSAVWHWGVSDFAPFACPWMCRPQLVSVCVFVPRSLCVCVCVCALCCRHILCLCPCCLLLLLHNWILASAGF